MTLILEDGTGDDVTITDFVVETQALTIAVLMKQGEKPAQLSTGDTPEDV